MSRTLERGRSCNGAAAVAPARAAATLVLLTIAVGTSVFHSGASAAPNAAQGPNADIPRVSNVTTTQASDLELIRALDAFIPQALRNDNVPGLNIALARGGKIVWEAGYGYADAAARKPMTPDTVFRSGSMGKTYTATAIMQLVDSGVLRLDDPIEKHLPFKVSNPYGGPVVTISHLLTHTSGLGGDGASSVFGKTRSLEETVRANYARATQPFFGDTPTWAGPAGEQVRYSNLGIATMGLIVERTNPEKLPFGEYVQRHVYEPLKLGSTQYPRAQSAEYVRPDIWARMSTGYNSMGGVWLPTPLVYFEEYPAGGFVSVPREHLRFIVAMMHGGEYDGARILHKDTVAKMLSPQIEKVNLYGKSAPNIRLGLVWWLNNWDKPYRSFSHSGGHMYGWRTNSVAWPEYDTAVVFAVNQWSVLNQWNVTTGAASIGGIVQLIEAQLKSEPLPPAPAPEQKPMPTGIDRLEWKTSYLRGLLFVEGYGFSIGIPTKVSVEQAEQLLKRTTTRTWQQRDALWDPEGFLQGVRDMNAVAPTRDAIHAFAKSKQMKISLEEARRIAPYIGLGEGNFASLAGLIAPLYFVPR